MQLATVSNRIGADEGPSQRRKAVGQPQRNTAGEHHIHRKREPVCLARTNDHDGLGQERGLWSKFLQFAHELCLEPRLRGRSARGR